MIRVTRTMAAATTAGVGAIALMLTGCTGEPAPIVTETPSPTTADVESPSPSASPSASGELTDEELLALLPPGAERDDVQGAVVTAEWYIEALGSAYSTKVVDPLRWLATSECGYCGSQVAVLTETFDAGWSGEGGSISARETSAQTHSTDSSLVLVTVTADVEDLYSINPDGKRELAQAGGRREFLIEMKREEALWLVNGVALEPA